MNIDPALRQAIDSMSAEDWLQIRFVDKKRKNANKTTENQPIAASCG
jgi:hypothetical protein